MPCYYVNLDLHSRLLTIEVPHGETLLEPLRRIDGNCSQSVQLLSQTPARLAQALRRRTCKVRHRIAHSSRPGTLQLPAKHPIPLKQEERYPSITPECARRGRCDHTRYDHAPHPSQRCRKACLHDFEIDRGCSGLLSLVHCIV